MTKRKSANPVPQAQPASDELQEAEFPQRDCLPATRQSITHKFSIGDCDGYVIVGLYEDDRPAEIFLKIARQGTTISGFADAVAVLTSVALQCGVPIETLARKLAYSRFEPSGWTENEEIRRAHSIIDYVFRWLGIRFSAQFTSGQTDAKALKAGTESNEYAVPKER